MKKVILSADGDRMLYSVPDPAADALYRFCMEFLHWMQRTPAGKKFWDGRGYRYTEADFIDWLNERFPEQRSVLLKDICDYDADIPAEYRDLPYFNF